ncbi:beta-N-acetylhexosaminidase [Sphingomicrobium sediminis]|uniref:beta-N-acetylhexosaminidase n=1 Tax=Sphingomicrobium sediminis TaxID=2950949 RepID=A0A9X2ELB7_9SPHN|nr:beta-N-acetylhexosaminidase [Sphingomicrobium sediminis]MCM8557552.1 beta-N-acetylhexosaminidase [Sphingomicrobium sediminis]
MQAVIYGMSGLTLTDEETRFFKDANPAGYILFGRNVEDMEQLRGLTDSLKSLHGRDDLPILIDQEGGRVARMRPPEFPEFPAMGKFAKLYDIAPSSAIEAARANARAIGLMLAEAGITVDALPVLDVLQQGADEIVGDRSLGAEPMQVAALGRAVIEGLHSAGVVSIIKHIPGHGRAMVDSHKDRPVVQAIGPDLDLDLAPFESLSWAPMAMVAHIVYTAWDPDHIATQSPTVIGDIIRGRIGFDGWLMSDDLNMAAMEGSMAERAQGVIEAGCDVALHCSGKMDEMVDVAKVVPDMHRLSCERMDRAMAIRADAGDPLDLAAALEKRDQLLALA